MKTVFDAKQWILETLLSGGAKDVVNGGIYKDQRPTDSVKEDIVINDVAMDGSYFQDGIFNVNVYVPFLNVKVQGVNQTQPDHNRIRVIASGIYPILDKVYTKDFNMAIVGHRSYTETALKANYINFRINLKAYN